MCGSAECVPVLPPPSFLSLGATSFRRDPSAIDFGSLYGAREVRTAELQDVRLSVQCLCTHLELDADHLYAAKVDQVPFTPLGRAAARHSAALGVQHDSPAHESADTDGLLRIRAARHGCRRQAVDIDSGGRRGAVVSSRRARRARGRAGTGASAVRIGTRGVARKMGGLVVRRRARCAQHCAEVRGRPALARNHHVVVGLVCHWVSWRESRCASSRGMRSVYCVVARR